MVLELVAPHHAVPVADGVENRFKGQSPVSGNGAFNQELRGGRRNYLEQIMKAKRAVKGVLIFVAGMLVASIFIPGLFSGRNANADEYSCIRTDLNARGMSGNVPDTQFTITYEIPSCLTSKGYHVEKVWMRGGEVAVQYKK